MMAPTQATWILWTANPPGLQTVAPKRDMPGEKARFSERNLAQTIMANAPRRSGAGILEYVTLLEIQSEWEKNI